MYIQGQFAEIALLCGSAMVCIAASCILCSIKGSGCCVLIRLQGDYCCPQLIAKMTHIV